MLRIGLPALVASWLLTGLLTAADLDQVDRTIRKEPAYQTKSPRYGLLVFGPDATDRVWLVLDGDALYVDRNGNGDLTEPGEKIAAKVDKSRDTAEVGYTFEVGDLAVGGKIHKGLIVGFAPLARYATNPTIAAFPPFQDALKADPKAHMAYVTLDVESARLKGGSVGNRLAYIAGPNDATGYLIFARQQARAPLVHFDGPLCITFYGRAPTLRLARDNDLILMVGTPGRGPGTFAMLCYLDRKRMDTLLIGGTRTRHVRHALLPGHDARESISESGSHLSSGRKQGHAREGGLRTQAAMLKRQPARPGPGL